MAIEPLLVFVDDSDRQNYSIKMGVHRIGRASFNEVQIKHPKVSKLHCVLVRSPDGAVVYDASKNGTSVGRQKAEGQLLADGDEITLGDHYRLVFFCDAQNITSGHKKQGAPPEQKVPSEMSINTPEEIRIAKSKFIVASILVGSTIFLLLLLTFATQRPDINLQQQLSDYEIEKEELQEQLSRKNTEIKVMQEQYQQEKDRLYSEISRNTQQNKELRVINEQLKKQLKKIEQKFEKETAKEAEEIVVAEKIEVDEAEDAVVKTEEHISPEESKVPDSQEKIQEKNEKKEDTSQKPVVSREQLDAMEKRLIEVLESYASPIIDVNSLDPTLMVLISVGSVESAQRIVNVEKHSRVLLKELEENIDFLQKRNTKLLDAAKANQNLKQDEKEHYQRLLELSQKKVDLQLEQVKRLSSLRAAVLSDYSLMASDELMSFWIKTFEEDSDPDHRKAILEIFVRQGEKTTVPVLIKALRTKNKDVQKEIFSALKKITGADVEDDRAAWENWLYNQDE